MLAVNIKNKIDQFLAIMTLVTKIEDLKYSSAEASIRDVIQRSRYKDADDTVKLAVRRLIAEDCGLLALSVGLALEQQGVAVTYHTNGYHYYFSCLCPCKSHTKSYVMGTVTPMVAVNRRYYFDIINADGTELPSRDMVNFGELSNDLDLDDEGDSQWLHERLNVDVFYRVTIQTFVRMFHIGFEYPYPLREV